MEEESTQLGLGEQQGESKAGSAAENVKSSRLFWDHTCPDDLDSGFFVCKRG